MGKGEEIRKHAFALLNGISFDDLDDDFDLGDKCQSLTHGEKPVIRNFKYVFIAVVNHRIIPLPSAINKTDSVTEAESITAEKCLLYVTMTRAQKGVYITSYGRKSEYLGYNYLKALGA